MPADLHVEQVSSDIAPLVRALASSPAYDRLQLGLSAAQWNVLAHYLEPLRLHSGQTLMEQGGQDRSVYLVEAGSLSVHYEDRLGRVRLAMVGPGSVLGEGAFLSQRERSATVQAANPVRLWMLSAERWAELAQAHPAIAQELAHHLGLVLAQRAMNRTPLRSTS